MAGGPLHPWERPGGFDLPGRDEYPAVTEPPFHGVELMVCEDQSEAVLFDPQIKNDDGIVSAWLGCDAGILNLENCR